MSRQQQQQQNLGTLWYLIVIQLYLLVATIQAQDLVKKSTTTTANTSNVQVPTTVAPIAAIDGELIKSINFDTKSTLASGTNVALSSTTIAPSTKASINVGTNGDGAASSIGLKLSSPSADVEGPSSPIDLFNKLASTSTPTEGKLTVRSLEPVAASSKSEAGKLNQYFKPICDSLDKLQPKELSKIQSQLKQFIEKTNGKLSVCFMTNFKINPGQSLIEKSQLESICAAKKLPNDAVGSFGMFESCSLQNWDQQLDKQLDKIIAARLYCVKNHNHSATISNNCTMSLMHDDITSGEDESDFGLLGDVVSKMLEGGKDSVNKSDIKFVDITSNLVVATATTLAPKLIVTTSSALIDSHVGMETQIKLPSSPQTTTVSPAISVALKLPTSATTTPPGDLIGDLAAAMNSNSSSDNTSKSKLLNDPNNVFVFVDETSAKSTTTKPETLTNITTSGSRSGDLVKTIEQKTIVASPSSPTTETKATIATTVAPKTVKLVTPKSTTTTTTKSKVVVLSTKKPASVSGGTSTKKPTTVKPGLIIKLINKSTESSSLETTYKDMLKRQEKERQELDKKLKSEREKLISQMKQKQDELDARNAIKQLQLQRAASIGHQSHSDARMHQIEHERQMAIDPIGHSIKHQQYEFSKQQRAIKVPV